MRKSILFLLALLGLFDSLYLLWIYTSPTRTMVCLGTGCDTVRLSNYSHIHGIPMPLIGVAGYVLIALLILAESLAPAAVSLEVGYALAAVTGLGFLYSVYLEYLQGLVIHAWCAWCITSGVVMTALCALAFYQVLRPDPQPDPPAQLGQVRAQFTVGVLALLIGVPAFYELATHGEAPPPPPPSANEATAEKLVRPDSHFAGDPNAAVTVVEFGDFECPVCGREEPMTRELRAKYGHQIRFVFRQFPLIHTHKFSARMAEASECAAEQGKFWEAVERIYANQDDASEEGLKRDAAAIGLDADKFNQCMARGAATARVNRDREDGLALGVVATPTFFVGRHPVDDVPDLAELSRLIDEDLAVAKGAPSPASAPQTSGAPPAAAAPPTASAPATPKGTSKTEATTPQPAPATTPSGTSSFGSLGSAPGGILSTFQGNGVACSEAEAAEKQPTQIDTEQLRPLLAAKVPPLFVDVRSPKDFAAGQIPGAINLPIDDMPKRWDTLPKDRLIIFYESGKSSGDICASSRAAGRILLKHGYAFDQVKVYKDGLAGWQKAGL